VEVKEKSGVTESHTHTHTHSGNRCSEVVRHVTQEGVILVILGLQMV